MPIAFTFSATSAEVMEDHFVNNTLASYLYTIIAQPVQTDAS